MDKVGKKRARTPAQKAASKANGSRSRGPVTAEGKKKTRLNAVTHGFFVRAVDPRDTIYGNREEFQQLVDDLEAFFKPKSRYIYHLIELLAVDYWRLGQVLQLQKVYFVDGATIRDVRVSAGEPNLWPEGEKNPDPKKCRAQQKILLQLDSMVSQCKPVSLSRDDANMVAGVLAPTLEIVRELYHKDGTSARKLAVNDRNIQEVTVAMLTSGKKMTAKKNAWVQAVKHALYRVGNEINMSREIQERLPFFYSKQAERWELDAADDGSRTASFETLCRYESQIQRSIDRRTKSLLSLKGLDE